MTDMYPTTPELFDAVAAAIDATGWTWQEVKERGGPSSTTMTRLRARTLERIEMRTLRKLDTSHEWPLGVSRRLVDDSESVRAQAFCDVNAWRDEYLSPKRMSTRTGHEGTRGVRPSVDSDPHDTDPRGLTMDQYEAVARAAALLLEVAALLATIKPETTGAPD